MWLYTGVVSELTATYTGLKGHTGGQEVIVQHAVTHLMRSTEVATR